MYSTKRTGLKWHYYTSINEKTAKCLSCNKIIKYNGGDTSQQEWIQLYFKRIDEITFLCSICKYVVITDLDCNEDLMNHIKTKHSNVYHLHKYAIQDQSMGFKIEFIKMDNVEVHSEPEKKKVTKKVLKASSKSQVTIKSTCKDADTGKYDRRKRSWVWKYFIKISNILYKCTLCNSLLSIKGLNTNNMNRHVRTKHLSVFESEVFDKKQKTLYEVDGKEELDESIEKTTWDAEKDKKCRRSWIWAYFDHVSKTLAQCKLCSRIICHGGSATGNMNRHMKMVHKNVYVNYAFVVKDYKKKEEVIEVTDETLSVDLSWIWKLFSTDDDTFYSCKICQYQCAKFADLSESVTYIVDHLGNEHGITSGDQVIIAPPDCGASVTVVDECSAAVDFLKGVEVLEV